MKGLTGIELILAGLAVFKFELIIGLTGFEMIIEGFTNS